MNIVINDKKKKELFTSIFHLLKGFSTHINATFEKTYLHIQGMDKSHICLFDLKLTDSWFGTYSVENRINLCFDAAIFYSMISIKSEEQSLIIRQDNDDELSIELSNDMEKKSDYNKFFTLPLIDYDYSEMSIPSTDYDAEFALPSKKVADMLSQLLNFGDNINIICTESSVDFKTTGTAGVMRVNVPIEDMSSYSVVEDEEINLVYSLIYISKLCITNKLSQDIEFSLSNECPMRINYELGDNSFLMIYIAPKFADE